VIPDRRETILATALELNASLSPPRITRMGALTASNSGHIPGEDVDVPDEGAIA
jgi:hypothetical protein